MNCQHAVRHLKARWRPHTLRTQHISYGRDGSRKRSPTEDIESENEHRHRLRALQQEDQQMLMTNKKKIDSIIFELNMAKAAVASLPHHSPLPINDRDGPSYEIPAYTLGAFRAAEIEFPQKTEKAIERAEYLKLHLSDLQSEPYPDMSRSELTDWLGRTQALSRREKEDLFEDLKLSLEGDKKRLGADVTHLEAFIRSLRAATEQRPAPVVDNVPETFEDRVMEEMDQSARGAERSVKRREREPATEVKRGRKRPLRVSKRLSASGPGKIEDLPEQPEDQGLETAGLRTEQAREPEAKKQEGSLFDLQSKLMAAIKSGKNR